MNVNLVPLHLLFAVLLLFPITAVVTFIVLFCVWWYKRSGTSTAAHVIDRVRTNLA